MMRFKYYKSVKADGYYSQINDGLWMIYVWYQFRGALK